MAQSWGNRTLARAWRGHGAGVARTVAIIGLGWRGRGAGVARACPVPPVANVLDIRKLHLPHFVIRMPLPAIGG
eukprot:gene17168-biopygen21855